MGMGSGPESLNLFLLESEFWQRLGLNSEAIDRLPWQKYRDYVVYIELFSQRAAKEQAAQQAELAKLGR